MICYFGDVIYGGSKSYAPSSARGRWRLFGFSLKHDGMFLLNVGLAIVGVDVPIWEFSFLVKLPLRLFL